MLRVFSLRDSQADAFMHPMFLASKGLAVRSVQDTMVKSGNPLYSHPEDFTLFELGTFDEVSGLITVHPSPVRVISALELQSQASAAS